MLIFEMGLYEAPLPANLRYSDIHFWLEMENGKTRCGLSSFASRLLGDVFSLEWQVKPGDVLEDAAVLGEIESTKATSELYSPLPGTLLQINQEPLEDPSMIAHDPYGTWLLEFEGEPKIAMDVQEYHKFLTDNWEETERLLKGQI